MFQGGYSNQPQMMNWFPNQQQNSLQNNFQPYQVPIQRPVMPTIPGKVVGQLNDIAPSDVPMDGSISIFPMQDESCILAKSWSTDGTIRTIKYVPEKTQKEDHQITPDKNDEILDRLTTIEKLLNRRQDNNRKEGATNGN